MNVCVWLATQLGEASIASPYAGPGLRMAHKGRDSMDLMCDTMYSLIGSLRVDMCTPAVSWYPVSHLSCTITAGKAGRAQWRMGT